MATEISPERLEKAQEVLHIIVEAQKRWGKHGGMANQHPDAVLDALFVVSESGGIGGRADIAELREALTKSNRQLGASKARETKLKADVKALRFQIDSMATNEKECLPSIESQLDA